MLPILRHILTSTPKILLFDSFNRPDTESGLGNDSMAEKGGKWFWRVASSRVKIQDGAVVPTGENGGYCIADVGRADYAMTVVMRSISNNPGFPVIFRYVGVSNYLRLRVMSGEYCFYDFGTSVLNNIAPAASGDIVKVVLKGRNIKFYVNGEFKAEVAYDKNIGSTLVGVGPGTTTSFASIDEIKVVSL